MLVMQHPVFRRFWYPTVALHDLAAGPMPFTLLGQKLVLWADADGAPVAFHDRCPHRGVALSMDSRVIDGALRCGYHGWRYAPTGAVVEIPQQPPGQSTAGHRRYATRVHCSARYGYAWVCLDEPMADIPDLPHADDPGFRQIFEFDEPWPVNMFRIIENALDIAHVSYVHTSTFGNEKAPVALRLDIIDEAETLGFRCDFQVVNSPEQQRNLRIATAETFRRQRILTWIPCAFNIHITYPNGLIHSICGFATPIGDQQIQRIQFVYRNDSEVDAPAAGVAAFDRKVQGKDKRLLETMEADFPLSPQAEAQMAMDRAGLMLRERLVALIFEHDPNAHLVRAELAVAAGGEALRLAKSARAPALRARCGHGLDLPVNGARPVGKHYASVAATQVPESPMRSGTKLVWRMGAALAIAVCTVNPALAAWPDEQPLKLIVPQAPGGTNDTVARIVSQELARALKQSAVIENRPGAAGAIGMQAVVQAKPDGYTLALASDSAALLDTLRPTLNWKFRVDLQAIAMIGDQPIVIAVSARSPYRSFADVVRAAQESPDRIGYATSGVGTSQHVVGEWLARLAAARLVHIPYKGGGQASTDLVGGQVPVAVLGLAPMLAQRKNGGVRIVAVTSPKRHAALPDVPSLTELGFPQIALTQWVGIVAPKNTPVAVVKRLSDEMTRIVALPEVRKTLQDIGIDPEPMNSERFDRFLKDTGERWDRLVPTLNLKLE